MKKSYVKPYIAVESFQIDAAIASCSSQGFIPIGKGESDCSFANGQFFDFNRCQVDLTGPGSDGNDTLCYHGPTLAGETFIAS